MDSHHLDQLLRATEGVARKLVIPTARLEELRRMLEKAEEMPSPLMSAVRERIALILDNAMGDLAEPCEPDAALENTVQSARALLENLSRIGLSTNGQSRTSMAWDFSTRKGIVTGDLPFIESIFQRSGVPDPQAVTQDFLSTLRERNNIGKSMRRPATEEDIRLRAFFRHQERSRDAGHPVHGKDLEDISHARREFEEAPPLVGFAIFHEVDRTRRMIAFGIDPQLDDTDAGEAFSAQLLKDTLLQKTIVLDITKSYPAVNDSAS